MTNTSERIETLLEDWNQAIDDALADGAPERAAALSAVVLRHLPRHIATYQRLLHATWALKRWQEGEDWARRLLQADPGNVLAWRALARAAEQRDQRAQSHAMWQRAFEMSPYDPELRAGLVRTSLNTNTALTLNLACLAALYMRGLRWQQAADVYRALVRADARRIDFQLGLTVALWQSRATNDAYALARHIVGKHPYLLMGWVALDVLGDENDQALARNPIETMDPDGDFVRSTVGVQINREPVILSVSRADADLLGIALPEVDAADLEPADLKPDGVGSGTAEPGGPDTMPREPDIENPEATDPESVDEQTAAGAMSGSEASDIGSAGDENDPGGAGVVAEVSDKDSQNEDSEDEDSEGAEILDRESDAL